MRNIKLAQAWTEEGVHERKLDGQEDSLDMGGYFFVEKFSEVMYLVLDSLDIETNGWNSGDNLAQFQLVQDSGLENSERWLINY